MSTSGGYHEYIRGYHEYIGDVQYIGEGGIRIHVGEQQDGKAWGIS